MPKFNAYGRVVAAERTPQGWALFDVGAEGKRRIAHDIVVPDFVGADELAQYLADLLHESASPRHPEVTTLPD
jgi:hypothetical protein